MDWKRRSVLFLAVCFLLRSQAAAAEDNTWDLTEEEDSELERELKTLNKPYVKSFKVTEEMFSSYPCVYLHHVLLLICVETMQTMSFWFRIAK